MTFAFAAVGAGGLAVFAQVAATTSAGDPIQALYSLLGSSPFALVGYFWIKDLRKQRDDAMTHERDVTDKLAKFIETDAEWKGAVRSRLTGQGP